MDFICFECFAIPSAHGADKPGNGIVPCGRSPSGGAFGSITCVRCTSRLRLDGHFASWYRNSATVPVA